MRQLPPVLDKRIFEKSQMDGRPSIAPCHWNENFEIYYLTQKMRCKEDVKFAEICDRVGKGQITEADTDFFKSRIIDTPEEDNNENYTNGKLAIIVTMNEKRDEINLNKLRKLLPNKKEYVCLAKDKVTNLKKFVPPPESVSYSKSHGMMKNLILREGAPVVVTVNHKKAKYKEDGIVNGAKGYIDHIQTSKENNEEVEIVWVVFTNEDIGKRYRRDHYNLRHDKDFLHERSTPILPERKPFEVSQGNLHYVRSQFPISLCYAMTAHKCQGDTLDYVIVDFRPTSANKVFIDQGSFYVAITRVRSASKLFMKSFDTSYIKVHPKVEYEIETMRKFRGYRFLKIYIDEQIFHPNQELKVGYLNINSLLDGYHSEYLNSDFNLLSLDILALAETHLTQSINHDSIKQILNNWKIIYRMDAGDSKKHMGLLVLSPMNVKLPENIEFSPYSLQKNSQTQVQGINVKVNEHSIAFLYCRVTPTKNEAKYILEHTKEVQFIMGDLNLDPRIDEQEQKLVTIRGNKQSILNEFTTKQNKQLDHIIGEVQENRKVYTTTYRNFISDHRSITLRISEPNSTYIDDPRLIRRKES